MLTCVVSCLLYVYFLLVCSSDSADILVSETSKSNLQLAAVLSKEPNSTKMLEYRDTT